MSKVGDKEAVFRTTQVRTKLRGDNSWLQRRSEPQAEATEEKPWIAEVRASRVNGAPLETSPVSSPTKPTPPPTKTDTERAPTSGYLIRGVFTKLDKPVSSTTSNGYRTTQITKKPSESYKKIAPYTLRPTSGNQDDLLSQEEQEKRTEAASSVLKKSSVKQRSYVFSAAKKYESKDETPDTSNLVSFVAKRVEITDDDESVVTPAPASPPPSSSVAPATSVSSAPQPRPRRTVKTAVDVIADEPAAPKEEPAVPKEEEVVAPKQEEVAAPKQEEVVAPKQEEVAVAPKEEDVVVPKEEEVAPKQEEVPVAPKEEEVVAPKEEVVAPKQEVVMVAPKEEEVVAPEPVKEDPAQVSVTEKDPFEDMIPGCTKVATPLPVLLPEYVQAVHTDPEPEDSPLVELAPALPTPMSPSQASPGPASPTPVCLTPLSPTPVSPAPLSPGSVFTVKTEPKPELSPSSGVDTLTALSDTLISFDTSSSSFKDDEPVLAEEEGGSADARTTENGDEQEPAAEHSNCVPMTDDLLALSDGPEAPAERVPVPPSPGRWSQDLLGGLDSESNPAKTSDSRDLLADNVLVTNTEARSPSMQQEEEKQTDETAKEAQSPTETVTITTKTVIITDKSEEDNTDPWSSHVTTTVTESSSADPFDPYPIGTTSPNSSDDLLQPPSDTSINSMSGNVLESLADDIIPIDTSTASLSTRRSWTHSWETSTAQQADTEKSQEAAPESQAMEQDVLIMFERTSTENDSPWNKWTSPIVYTTTAEEEEEEEEEEEKSPGDTQTQTVTTVTTIREIRSEPDPAMDRYETYSRTVKEEDQRVQTPEPEAKKPFVYVKECVNATELSLHNARDAFDGAPDYLECISTPQSYVSPSIYSSGSLSSTCTYCGGLVGNDAKISIEHLNINCHPACFLCAVCSKPMGDLLDSMFLHGGKVHCESCYSKAME